MSHSLSTNNDSPKLLQKPAHNPQKHNLQYYLKCMIGGILSCGITHTAICPIDVLKCNMQVHPEKFKGFFSGMRLLIREEGVRSLFKGWAPTAIGYSLQGMGKFGLYEVFKDLYSGLAGEEKSMKYRRLIWLAGSASAEFFADMLLCPMEMVKVKVQTAAKGTWPTGLISATNKMIAQKSSTGFPYGSLMPLWTRQIPYTMAKFYFFEEICEMYYRYLFTKPRETYSKAVQLGITFCAGYNAGVICAIVSHPADTLVSLRGKTANKGKTFGAIAREFGYSNLMTKGLFVRILMIGTLTGFQWWIYDSFKTAMGLGTSGGGAANKSKRE